MSAPGEFDWAVLGRPEGIPLSELGGEPAHLVRGLYRCADAVYAVTNLLVYGGTDDDPGVGGVLWAATEPVAVRAYENAAAGSRPLPLAGATPLPPVSVLGTEQVGFRAVVALESARGGGEVRTGRTIPDGHFTTTRVAGDGRTWYFGSEEPAEDEQPIAIRFDLPRAA